MLMDFGTLIMITTDQYMQLREIMLFDQLDLSTGLTGQNCCILLGYPQQGNIDVDQVGLDYICSAANIKISECN